MVLLRSKLKHMSEHISGLLHHKLWLQVIIGMLLGIVVGIILGPDSNIVSSEMSVIITDWLALPGNLFLQLIKLVVIPLIFSSIIVGILSSGNPKLLKKMGPRVIIYFVITTIIAVGIGIFLAMVVQPGNYVNFEATESIIETAEYSALKAGEINIPEALVSILPHNPIESMVNADMLGIVIFTIIFGVALLYVGKKHLKLALNLLETVQSVSMIVVKWAMYLAPIAVFGLMTKVTSQVGVSAFAGVMIYVFTVLGGLLILLLFYYLIIFLFTSQKPLQFINAIKNVQLLAFSTSSSAAVMPLSLKTAEDNLKVNPLISRFIIPVGATINMNGTALYQSVATIFLAQVYGIHLSIFSILLIVAITVGASIGTPSAPGVGIIILATILATVGIPAAGIALILGVDRILDMSRTAVNVAGDLTACSFFDKHLSGFFKK